MITKSMVRLGFTPEVAAEVAEVAARFGLARVGKCWLAGGDKANHTPVNWSQDQFAHVWLDRVMGDWCKYVYVTCREGVVTLIPPSMVEVDKKPKMVQDYILGWYFVQGLGWLSASQAKARPEYVAWGKIKTSDTSWTNYILIDTRALTISQDTGPDEMAEYVGGMCGLFQSWAGPGRGYSGSPIVQVQGHRALVVQFCGVDV